METGHDILFFWVARMMMLGIHLTDAAPFHTVFLSGLIRDERGQRMSKTKGNVIDPLEVMEETGADALRFAVIHGATAGQDQKFGQQKLEVGRNFANKLWNVTRFVLGARPASIPADAARQAPDAAALGPVERWIRSRTAATVEAVDRAIAGYQLAEVTRVLVDAIWSELCDWGVEMAKVRLSDASLPNSEREATWWTLVEALDTDLRLLHPVMPFVTEALWGALPHAADDPELLIVATWPVVGARDEAAERDVAAAIELIRAIRNARADAGVEPAAWVPVDVRRIAGERGLGGLEPAVERLARARPLTISQAGSAAGGAPHGGPGGAASIAVVTPEFEASISRPAAAGASDADRARLEKELSDAEARLAAARGRLADPRFLERAPAHVVEGARASEAELAGQVARLRGSLARP